MWADHRPALLAETGDHWPSSASGALRAACLLSGVPDQPATSGRQAVRNHGAAALTEASTSAPTGYVLPSSRTHERRESTGHASDETGDSDYHPCNGVPKPPENEEPCEKQGDG